MVLSFPFPILPSSLYMYSIHSSCFVHSRRRTAFKAETSISKSRLVCKLCVRSDPIWCKASQITSKLAIYFFADLQRLFSIHKSETSPPVREREREGCSVVYDPNITSEPSIRHRMDERRDAPAPQTHRRTHYDTLHYCSHELLEEGWLLAVWRRRSLKIGTSFSRKHYLFKAGYGESVVEKSGSSGSGCNFVGVEPVLLNGLSVTTEIRKVLEFLYWIGALFTRSYLFIPEHKWNFW